MVVNAHHMHNLPGRKSDVKDSEWIATLFRHGLLEPSFVPNRLIRNLREYSRLHRSFVRERACYSNRLEKFLQAHGFKLSSVLSSILGVSGRRLITTLSQKGVLSPIDVSDAMDKGVKKSIDEIRATITGKLDYSECSYLKILLDKINAIYREIADILALMKHLADPYKIQLEQFDSIPGIDVAAALAIMAETSATPQDSFENSKKLISWLDYLLEMMNQQARLNLVKLQKAIPILKQFYVRLRWQQCVHEIQVFMNGFGHIKVNWVEKRLLLLWRERF